MLTELCQELHNWFDRNMPKKYGNITISDGTMSSLGKKIEFLDGQYYRIIGSIFNDGVHLYGSEDDVLVDENFNGSVWAMAIPKEVVKLADDIATWRTKYEAIDSVAMSPYSSESFGGYSYSKGGGSGGSSGGGADWRTTFRVRLNMWRKI